MSVLTDFQFGIIVSLSPPPLLPPVLSFFAFYYIWQQNANDL